MRNGGMKCAQHGKTSRCTSVLPSVPPCVQRGLRSTLPLLTTTFVSLQESGVGFQLLLANGRKAQLHVYLVHEASHPPASHLSARPASARKAAKAAQGAASGSGGAGSGGGSDGGASPPAPLHSWHLVSRSDCCKGCSGPVLRAIRRFGPPSRRKGGAPPPADSSLGKKVRRRLGDAMHGYTA